MAKNKKDKVKKPLTEKTEVKETTVEEAAVISNDKKFYKKKIKHGVMATAVTAIFIAVVVLVNIIATVLFDRYPITFDLTKENKYSIAEEAKEYVKGIDQKVYITVLAKQDAFENIVYGSEYTKQASQLIDKYTKYNSNIEVKYVDFLSSPEVLKDYTETQNLEQYDIIFETRTTSESGEEFKRIKVVRLMDLVNLTEDTLSSIAGYYGTTETFIQANGGNYTAFIQLSYYGNMIESSNAETAFTSALMSVADNNPIKVTFLDSSRKEADMTYFKSLLESNAYVIEQINISSAEIPEDTDILVIPAPKIDYTAIEVDKVDKFLDNDGRLGKHLLYIASVEQAETPNLDEFLEEYGLEVKDEMIYEQDANYYYEKNTSIVQRVIGENYLQDLAMGKSSAIYIPNSRVIKPLYDEDGMKRTEAYLSSSESAVAMSTNFAEDGKFEERGALYSMVFGSKVRFADDKDKDSDNKYSHVMAFGSEYYFDVQVMGSTQFQNSSMIISLFNGITNKTAGVYIEPKAVGAVNFDITAKQANILKYTYVFIIPAIILIIGLVVYLRRKNK
ncbi:MAG: GldG family protein [Clostridiales bacterium]|nr:GldG family protein [Clostridiales bacterium]